MGSSKQLTKDLKIKLTDSYTAEEGYKKTTTKCFQLMSSTVQKSEEIVVSSQGMI